VTRVSRATAVVAVVLAAGLAASGCARRTRTATSPTSVPGAAPTAPGPVTATSPRITPPGGGVTTGPIAQAPAAPAATPAPVPYAQPGAAATPAPAASPAPGGANYTTQYAPGGSFAASAERRSRLDPIYFDFDEADLKPEYRRVLETNADWLRRNPQARIQIEGHCDERGSVQYNLALGERRAESARRYLESLGIQSSRMQTISYGEERPAVQGSSEEAWARNRRAEFLVTQ
jgi:peptidoglycan-associated lipoprotein